MLGTLRSEWQSIWQERLEADLPQTQPKLRRGVLNWLLETESIASDKSASIEAAASQQQLECRYRILHQRYLGIEPLQGYQRLLNRLGCLVTRYPKIRSRLSVNSEDRQTVCQLIQAVLEELLSQDAYLQGQKQQIAQCTEEPELRDALLFASLEAYCLQKSGSQCRFIECLIDFLRRQLAKD